MVRWAGSVGADSFDGSGPSRFGPDCLRRVDAGRGDTQMTFNQYGLDAPFKPREDNSK